MAAGRRGGRMRSEPGEEEPEPLSGMPEEAQDEDLPLGVPPEGEEADRNLPGFPEGDIDTAG
jgi:hypothetical protein